MQCNSTSGFSQAHAGVKVSNYAGFFESPQKASSSHQKLHPKLRILTQEVGVTFQTWKGFNKRIIYTQPWEMIMSPLTSILILLEFKEELGVR